VNISAALALLDRPEVVEVPRPVMLLGRRCKDCGGAVSGRADKRFCTALCRLRAFHNHPDQRAATTFLRRAGHNADGR